MMQKNVFSGPKNDFSPRYGTFPVFDQNHRWWPWRPPCHFYRHTSPNLIFHEELKYWISKQIEPGNPLFRRVPKWWKSQLSTDSKSALTTSNRPEIACIELNSHDYPMISVVISVYCKFIFSGGGGVKKNFFSTFKIKKIMMQKNVFSGL